MKTINCSVRAIKIDVIFDFTWNSIDGRNCECATASGVNIALLQEFIWDRVTLSVDRNTPRAIQMEIIAMRLASTIGFRRRYGFDCQRNVAVTLFYGSHRVKDKSPTALIGWVVVDHKPCCADLHMIAVKNLIHITRFHGIEQARKSQCQKHDKFFQTPR